ncbi:MAG: metal-dependent phosphohydrolase [Planctomycetota bacterium]|jgi:predicted hydrolase (HD superfamily)|nr:metal-dependent phosphohydrolase [Planctomycetota bacterium]
MDQPEKLTREAAWQHLCDWTPSEALRRHARAVEVCMRAAALKYGGGEADVEQWGLAGMLHDADYDQWPEEHPKRIVAWLEEQGEAAVAHAVSAHYTQWGVSYDTLLDKALLACDELTGLVMACCYVRPDGVNSIKAKSVMKKIKDKKFAAGVDRFEVHEGVRLLDVELRNHVEFIIDAIKPYAAELGIEGTGA